MECLVTSLPNKNNEEEKMDMRVNLIREKKDFVVVPRTYLARLRERENLTQYKVSNKIGIVQSEYNMIENGYRGHRMDARKLIQLAKAFNVSVEYMVNQEALYLDEFDEKNGREKKWR